MELLRLENLNLRPILLRRLPPSPAIRIKMSVFRPRVNRKAARTY